MLRGKPPALVTRFPRTWGSLCTLSVGHHKTEHNTRPTARAHQSREFTSKITWLRQCGGSRWSVQYRLLLSRRRHTYCTLFTAAALELSAAAVAAAFSDVSSFATNPPITARVVLPTSPSCCVAPLHRRCEERVDWRGAARKVLRSSAVSRRSSRDRRAIRYTHGQRVAFANNGGLAST